VAKDQACKLQILSVKHPDLLQVVDAMFDKYASVPQVRRMIEHKYHIDAGATAVSTYKKKHWQVRKDAVMERLTAMKAVAQLVGEDGLTAGVNALLWESLQEMTTPQLMGFKKVMNDGQKVVLMKKHFALYAQEHRQKMKERSTGTKAGKDSWETGDAAEDYAKAQRVVEQVKEIFGIGMTDIEPPRPPLLCAGKQDPPPPVLSAGCDPVGS
jgi:hypothetical protein